jgi:hypothetical protein
MDKNSADANHLKNDNKIRTSLNSLVVRLITPEEEIAWNNLMGEHHYLGFHT